MNNAVRAAIPFLGDAKSMAEDKKLYAEIGRRIRQARQGLKMTRMELANATGLPPCDITEIEGGRWLLAMHALRTIAEALGVRMRDLLPDEGDGPPPASDPLSARCSIYDAIDEEREHQIGKWGKSSHTVGEWLLVMQAELSEACLAWVKGEGDLDALCEILQVVTTGVACMEGHGVVRRMDREELERWKQKREEEP
mgnify:FL=1